MPLSGADMTSENTAAASFNRLAGSLSLANSGVMATAATRSNFIFLTLFLPRGVSRQRYSKHAPHRSQEVLHPLAGIPPGSENRGKEAVITDRPKSFDPQRSVWRPAQS